MTKSSYQRRARRAKSKPKVLGREKRPNGTVYFYLSHGPKSVKVKAYPPKDGVTMLWCLTCNSVTCDHVPAVEGALKAPDYSMPGWLAEHEIEMRDFVDLARKSKP